MESKDLSSELSRARPQAMEVGLIGDLSQSGQKLIESFLRVLCVSVVNRAFKGKHDVQKVQQK